MKKLIRVMSGGVVYAQAYAVYVIILGEWNIFIDYDRAAGESTG